MPTGKLTFTETQLTNAFPTNATIRSPRPIQRDAIVAMADGANVFELPTGSGKTALQYMFLQAALPSVPENEAVFWVFPTKALVQQVSRDFPDVHVIFGQNEHPCPWGAEGFAEEPTQWVAADQLPVIAKDKKVPRVSDVPSSMCGRCPHYVDQETGQTQRPGVVACPYYLQTHQAKAYRGIIAVTMSFYVFAKLFSKAYGQVGALAIDEVHRLADVIRYTLSYDISDLYISRAIRLLRRIDAPEFQALQRFRRAITGIAKRREKKPGEEHLLDDDEIRRLIDILAGIDASVLDPRRISDAVAAGHIDPQQDWRVIKTIETLARALPRYLHSLEYALAEEDDDGTVTRGPLNYSCSFYRKEAAEKGRVQHKLVIHCHYVGPLIRRRLVVPTTASFSATIGDPTFFKFETGIRPKLHSAPSTFPIGNRRIFVPSDAFDLSKRFDRTGRNKTRTLRLIAKGCRRLADHGVRSLVVVISNEERAKFMRIADQEGVQALTYSDGFSAKDAAGAFRDGSGEVLCGCASHYATGVDFPKGTAGVVWFLRPGYPNPGSAQTQFEQRRYGSAYWGRLASRMMLEAQQVVGRNIRGPRDKGVAILMSSQFNKFVHAGLPAWLQPAYRRNLDLDQCLEDTEQLLL